MQVSELLCHIAAEHPETNELVDLLQSHHFNVCFFQLQFRNCNIAGSQWRSHVLDVKGAIEVLVWGGVLYGKGLAAPEKLKILCVKLGVLVPFGTNLRSRLLEPGRTPSAPSPPCGYASADTSYLSYNLPIGLRMRMETNVVVQKSASL